MNDKTTVRPTVLSDQTVARGGVRRTDVAGPPKRPAAIRKRRAPKRPAARPGRWARVRDWAGVAGQLASPVLVRVRAALGVVSRLGWTLIALFVACWVLAALFGWLEFAYAAVVLGLVLVLSLAFCFGRMRLAVVLDVDPLRVKVGDSAAAQLTLRNQTKAPSLSMAAEFPVGLATARYTVPPLAPGAEHSELTIIPTQRRGVLNVGPVTTQRGDPFRIFRRELTWTQRFELFIHPQTVPLASLGAGLLRDLEGRTTNDVSMSDLAFHTLRQYVPGDDRRYIHWRSSAKASAAAGQDTFLVRQFLDTRRSHIAVLVDVDAESYESEEDFELAISAGASIAIRALSDQTDLSIVCGEHAVVQPPPHTALDTFSRAEFGPISAARAVANILHTAPDISSTMLCTGSRASLSHYLEVKAHLAPEVALVVLRANLGAPVSLQQPGGITVVTVGGLGDLQRVVATGVVAA